MSTETKTEEVKSEPPVLMTPGQMQLKILSELPKINITLPQLQERALKIVMNRDNLTVMRDLKADIKKGKDAAEKIFEKVKKPYWDAGKACDAGKKLVFGEFERIEGMFNAGYERLLRELAEETRLANLKIAQDAAILKGIEDNVIMFSNLMVAAITRKALTEAESRINLEKSPSRATKYGEHHAKAIQRYDTVLIPIIKDQKKKVDELEELNRKLLEAEANNDPDSMDILMEKVDEKSNEILQNHAVIQEAALNQDSFPVIEATEVLPSFKVKRTNYSFEIADLDVAIKKARGLLDITVNNAAAREVLDGLKEKNAFEGKDEVIVDGIKYIATRVREAL
jgi:hypothetical protein